ncbi:hypothetical protein ACFQ61_37005 [Streptomyces sp. NPDC056500]|uniref:hypothetical protein n=1 Tax=Streptomyces sp. NPDC056500 TaxID=3345840 RepID=UPI0036BB2991
MSASRAIRAAGAWGHLLLVVLALGVFAMHTVGHPESGSAGGHGAMASARPQEAVSGSGSAAHSGLVDEGTAASGTVAAGGVPKPLSVGGAPGGNITADGSGHHSPAVATPLRHTTHADPTGHVPPPVDHSAVAPLELVASNEEGAATGHGEQAGVHHHGMVMDMASLCVAILGSWILAALLRAALVRGSDWLPHLRAAALTALRPGAPPPRPHLTRLSVLRI